MHIYKLIIVPNTQCILNLCSGFQWLLLFLIVTWRKAGDKNTQHWLSLGCGFLDDFYLPLHYLHIL